MQTRRRRRRTRSASAPLQRASRQSQAVKQEIREGGEGGVGGQRAKAKLSERGDTAEVEARRVADRVVAQDARPGGAGGASPGPPAAARTPKTVHRAEAAASAAPAKAAPTGGSQLATGPATPLPAPERRFFEDRLGADLSHVGIRRDEAAASEADGYQARAFTEGSTISFAQDEWRPHSTEGRRLIAHELAHTLQQPTDGVVRRDEKDDGASGDAYKEEKQKAFKSEFPQKTWGVRKLDGSNATEFVKALVKAEGEGKVFKGSSAKFAAVVEKINAKKGVLAKGQWMAYPIGWKDPNIGDIAAEVKALQDPKAKDQKTDVIATIYAEQSHSREDEIATAKADVTTAEGDKSPEGQKRLKAAQDTLAEETKTGAVLDKQREYIYYAMLLRVASEQFPPTLDKVVTEEKFHGKKPGSSTYKANYEPAKEVVEKGSTKKPVNKDALSKVQALVGKASVKPPSDAGPFYFHWSSATTTAEAEFQAVTKAEVKAGKTKDEAEKVAEKKGAFKQAKDVVQATMSGVTEKEGWLNKIPGQNRGKADERFGSMYIYR